MPAALRLSSLDARRFHRRAVLLDTPAPNIAAALAHHGYVQMDPINVCGRMQDLILRNRVAGYREGDLVRHLHGPQTGSLAGVDRTAFEHHLPGSNILTALTLEAWPYLLSAMRHRSRTISSWSGKMDTRQRRMADSILSDIASRGPLSSQDLDDDQRVSHGWGRRASLAKTTLHKLFFHGRLLIARRVANRRFYDLPERVLPAASFSSPEPSVSETSRWVTLLKLRQRRLVTLSSAELRHVADLVQAIAVEGCPPLFCLREDLPLLDAVYDPDAPVKITLLAPLDPLIYDRRLTRQLWDYDYTWEVYTPPARRVRGYYALPVLAGVDLVGHIDPKADRANGKLTVANRSLRRGHRAATAVRELARFLSLK